MAAVALNLKCGMQSNCHRRLSSASLLRAASSTVKPPFTIFSLTLKRTSSTYSFNCSPCTLIHVGTLRNSVWSWHTLLFELLKNKKRKQCLIKYCTVIQSWSKIMSERDWQRVLPGLMSLPFKPPWRGRRCTRGHCLLAWGESGKEKVCTDPSPCPGHSRSGSVTTQAGSNLAALGGKDKSPSLSPGNRSSLGLIDQSCLPKPYSNPHTNAETSDAFSFTQERGWDPATFNPTLHGMGQEKNKRNLLDSKETKLSFAYKCLLRKYKGLYKSIGTNYNTNQHTEVHFMPLS